MLRYEIRCPGLKAAVVESLALAEALCARLADPRKEIVVCGAGQ